MNKVEERTSIFCKRKNIQILIDYCLEQRIGFTVNPRVVSNDDFEVEPEINSIKQALAMGMFLREHKFEAAGMGEMVKPKATPANKKAEAKTTDTAKRADPEDPSTLSFDLNVNSN